MKTPEPWPAPPPAPAPAAPPASGPLTLDGHEGVWIRMDEVAWMIGRVLEEERNEVHGKLISISTPVAEPELYERAAHLGDLVDHGREA